MKEQVHELLEIIRDEIRFYNDLLECEQLKTTLLTDGRLEELVECNKTEEDCIIRLQGLEVKRLSISEKLCGQLGIPREEFTLARIAGSLNDSRELNESAALLRDIVERVQVVLERNYGLIEKPLRYTEGLLSIFSNAAGPYQPDGTFNTEATVLPTFSKDA